MKINTQHNTLPILKRRFTACAIAIAMGSGVASVSAQQSSEKPEKAEVEVIRGQTDVQVKQPAPSVDINQKDAKVDVAVGKAKVDVEYKEPEISIKQQEPDVEIAQAEPEVIINSAEPNVKVNKAEPEVSIEKSEPEINIVREDQKGNLRKDSDIAYVNQLKIAELEGKDLINSQGEDVGEISEVVQNNQDKQLSLVIESGGIMGVGESKSVLPLDEVTLENNKIVWDKNKDPEQLPEFNESQYVALNQKEKTVEDYIGEHR
ncbi:PRC-barrel domain-containing protein [Alteromonas pelagimontana]|uniref:PRC-barrel domain-containing protein n=1 Tax=Alteromonas pelagimontana TaxID=1858656 RepID=A0A6M4MEL4_9ALTE|nr:PRC-barrel domain-containing protein [Alteromonas pelagimontana]QJR81631.1 PRC-barrel domain-containing protein [Alteromonas pelagimontana]